MIYKPRCPYAQTKTKSGALHCDVVNGYCGFQYRCEQTGQWENTTTAAGCKARKKAEAPADVTEMGKTAETKERNATVTTAQYSSPADSTRPDESAASETVLRAEVEKLALDAPDAPDAPDVVQSESEAPQEQATEISANEGSNQDEVEQPITILKR